jgi:ATP-dependent DNA helicase RecQ
MGFDKPDLSFVVHYQSPGSPVAYYQQVGRAGRAVPRALGVLLQGREDRDIIDYFITTAFPPEQQAEQVVGLLAERGEPVRISEIESAVNARRSRIEGMLKVLEVDGAVERSEGGWLRTLQPWSYDSDRVRRVTELRRTEQTAMADYLVDPGCRMRFLRDQLDDTTAEPCGRCDNCTGEHWSTDLDRDPVADAVAFLRSAELEIEPRLQWPAGRADVRGRIPRDHLLLPGRALSVYADGGWGTLVRQGKYEDGHFEDELVKASVALIRRWAPQPAPAWVTCVPSASQPDLVPDFARRLAARLRLEFRPVVRRVRPGRPQKEMENSSQQYANVAGAFEVAARPPPGPVLLVDDITDSRWTLTVIGVALREAGSGPVYPFVLAKAVSS